MKSSYFEGCQDHACLIQKPRQGTCSGRCRCSHAKIEAYINALKEERAGSQKRERILREGLEEYAQTRNWAHTEMNYQYRNWWMRWENGYDIAEATIKAAGEVK